LSQKVICDPIYGHVFLDRDKERLILKLINAKEVQRLRRIRQLGVSYFTYPGADHSRFSHALGTVCLMKQVLEFAKKNGGPRITELERLTALAAALLHDVGHGPFSHLL
jgi:HD superfamily phosphohydrolase